MTIKHILVPTDFGPDAARALAFAIDLAQQFGATIDLLHVVEDPMAAGMWSSAVYDVELAGLQINVVRDAEERLRRSIPSIAGARYGIEHEVRTGPAASTIVECARERLADLIVMGTSGRKGVSHLVMGSVAEGVIRNAPCPVLTMRAARKTGRKQKKPGARAA